MPAKPSKKDLSKMIDQMGTLRAQIADLQEEYEKVKNLIVVSGVDEAEGQFFKIKVTTYKTTRTDWKKIQEDYDLDLAPYAVESESQRVTISAR